MMGFLKLMQELYNKIILISNHTNKEGATQTIDIEKFIEISNGSPSKCLILDFGNMTAKNEFDLAKYNRKKVIQCILLFYMDKEERADFMAFIFDDTNISRNQAVERLCVELIDDTGEMILLTKPHCVPPTSGGNRNKTTIVTKAKRDSSPNSKKVNIS